MLICTYECHDSFVVSYAHVFYKPRQLHSLLNHVKILLDLFQIDYAGDKDKLIVWKAKLMLKTIVLEDLGTHQMFRFYHEFRITDPAAWSDLSFKQATALLKALNPEREVVAGLEAPAPNLVVPNTTVGITNVPFIFMSKK